MTDNSLESVKEQVVRTDTPLKEIFVQYVGEKLQPEDGEVTVHMIVSVLAEEFPEFIVAMAEENFIQGYKQAFADIEFANSNQQQEETVTE